jgi:hypothetical protein
MLRWTPRSGGPWLLAFASIFVIACGGADPSGTGDASAEPAAAPIVDASPHADASDAGHDAHAPDAGPDAEPPPDAGEPDADGDAGADAHADAEADAHPDAEADAHADADAEADAHVDEDAGADAHDAAPPEDAETPDAADASDASDAEVDAEPPHDAGAPDFDGDGTPDAIDCAPKDPHAWQLLPYSFRDGDGDGYFVSAPAGSVICAGPVLPPGFASTAPSIDCDDAHADVWQLLNGYADTDGDGVGAGPVQSVCSGAKLPDGFSTRDDDCAPGDKGAYQLLSYGYRDADGDGHTVVAPAGAQVCTGPSLPTGYTNTPGEPDCDDTKPKAWAWVDGYADTDSDKVGAGDVQRFCTDGQLPPGYVAHDGDCAPLDKNFWQLLPYSYRDADGDLHTVASSGSICSGATLPTGYATSPSGDDCNDNDPAVWTPQMLYVDGDDDGVGEGKPIPMCVAVSPKGYATVGGDCAPGDKDHYVMRAYSYRDADNDTYTVLASGTVCSGAALPTGYTTSPKGADCDDTNPSVWSPVTVYADADNDGVGAGPALNKCVGATIPDGFVTEGGDCAPSDPNLYWTLSYAYVDRDGDGATVPDAGTICGDDKGLPKPYFAQATWLDCDDTNAKLDHYGPLYVDGDKDGFGTGPALPMCLGQGYPTGYSPYGTDMDDGNASITEDPSDDPIDELFY